MTPGSFSEDDKKKVIEYLNKIADYATFTLKTTDLIAYFKLLAHMQQVILPKIEANILEVLRVVEPPKEETPPASPEK